jgi:hypothetical protein
VLAELAAAIQHMPPATGTVALISRLSRTAVSLPELDPPPPGIRRMFDGGEEGRPEPSGARGGEGDVDSQPIDRHW